MGKEKDADLKDLMQNFCVLMAVILSINFCVFFLFFNQNTVNLIISFIAVLVHSGVYLLSRFLGKPNPAIILMVIFDDFILTPVMWMTNGGILGFTPYLCIVFAAITVVFLKGKAKSRYGIGYSIFILGLVVMQSQYPHMVLFPISRLPGGWDKAIVFQMACIFLTGLLYVYSYETDRIQKKAVRLSFTDEMTGLYNWRFIRNNVQSDFNKSLQTGTQCAVLMIDIDNFKIINDRYGHQAGDKAIKMIASILKTSVRSIDVAGRYGGDEFFVMLPNINAQNAEAIAERIRKTVEDTFIKQGMPLTVSIGVADIQGGSLEEIFMNADKNMYKAKNTGKNKVRRAV